MSCLVLDAEALSSLARGGSYEAVVREALTAAVVERVDVVVPAAVLAECYRGSRHDPAIDACLSREGGIDVVDTDRKLARRVGHLLAAAEGPEGNNLSGRRPSQEQRDGRSVSGRSSGFRTGPDRGSSHHVDATVVASCAAMGGGLILTGDVGDLIALAPPGSGIAVRGLNER